MGQAAKPLDDLTYDLVTILHAKSKALEAYDKYIADAKSDDDARHAIESIREGDVRAVEQLKTIVAQRLGDGGARGAKAERGAEPSRGSTQRSGSPERATAAPAKEDAAAGHPKRSGAV